MFPGSSMGDQGLPSPFRVPPSPKGRAVHSGSTTKKDSPWVSAVSGLRPHPLPASSSRVRTMPWEAWRCTRTPARLGSQDMESVPTLQPEWPTRDADIVTSPCFAGPKGPRAMQNSYLVSSFCPPLPPLLCLECRGEG